jgi:hypothetical protein
MLVLAWIIVALLIFVPGLAGVVAETAIALAADSIRLLWLMLRLPFRALGAALRIFGLAPATLPERSDK